MAFTDDFNRADSAAAGNNWEERSDIYQILNNQVRTSGGGTNWRNSCLRPVDEAWENGTVEVEFTVATAFETYPRVEARLTLSGGTPTYYGAYTTKSTLTIGRYQSGSWTSLGSQTFTPDLVVGTAYKLIFILNGSSLTAEVRNAATGALLVTKNVTSTHITGAGRQGFAVSAAATQPTDFDNFSSSPQIDGAKSVADDGSGADAVSVTDSSGVKNPTDSGFGTDSISIGVIAPASDTGQGQDFVSITVSVNVGDSGTGADTPTVIEPAMLGLLERFDGALDNWTLDVSGGSIQIQTVNNDAKLVLNDTSASALVSATRAIEGQSAPFCIEADIYAGTGAIGLLEALDSSDNVIFSIKADAGAALGTFDTDNHTASTFALTASKYYQVVFYCDPLTNTVKAWYLTGTGTAPSAWIAIGAAKSYSGALVSKIRLTTDATATGEARFDEVKIFRPSVFCIGDSNTAGYAVTGAYWNPSPDSSQRLGSGEDETHAYPHLLGLKFNPNQWAANRGLNAAQSADLDARIQGDVIDQGAGTVAILVGTNDITAGVALATIEANIQSAAYKAATAGLMVCLCSVPPRSAWDSAQNTKRTSLNAWIQSFSATNGYRFADVYMAVKNPSNPDQLALAYDAGDGLHFTTTGLQVIADIVFSALLETKAISDAASGVDWVQVRNTVALAESALGGDSVNMLGLVSLTDSGAGADSLNIFAAIQLLELASAAEGLVSGGPWESCSVADSGGGADSVSAIIKEGATLQDIYDLTLTRLSAAAYTRPDNEGISSLLTHAVAMSKWKNNKLARTSVVGRVETWVLYDDDGTTPLLTWTHDAQARTRNKAY